MKFLANLSLTSKIIISLILGTITGLLFGDYNHHFKIFGDAFIQLLQMAVLPYITVSLIAGIGSLTLDQAKSMALKVGGVIFTIWALTFVVILAFTWTFPLTVSAHFFSEALIEHKEEIDLLKLYIPSNPFFALSNNLVPAVVVFSIFLGIALINTEKKENLIDLLQIFMKGLSKVTNFVVQLTPYGVFAITANAVGTMPYEDFEKLQVYLIMYIVASVLFTFWILPLMISALAPISFKDSITYTKDALSTAFTTGNLFVVIPMIIEGSKDMFKKHQLEKEQDYVDIVVPVSFTFPNAGKLLMLTFVTFAAWFSGTSMNIGDYVSFSISGLVTMFGATTISIPFLLEMLRIPQDLFDLFMMSTIVNSRMASLVAAMNLVAIAIVGAYAMNNGFKISRARVMRSLLLMLAGLIATIMATALYFNTMVNTEYKADLVVMEMESQVQVDVEETVHLLKQPKALQETKLNQSRLQIITERNVLRVGYRPNHMPYSYFNAKGKLVGFDVDAMRILASELGVKLEFIPVVTDDITQALDAHLIDIMVSGIAILPDNISLMSFSQPYQEAVFSFITEDHRAKDFVNIETVRQHQNLSFAVPFSSASVSDGLQALLKGTDTHFELIEDPTIYLENPSLADAMVYDAIAGSILTLMYPQYSVVVPKDKIYKVPVAYAIPKNDVAFAIFINSWIETKQHNGFFDHLYRYWMLGNNAAKVPRKWNIIDDVIEPQLSQAAPEEEKP